MDNERFELGFGGDSVFSGSLDRKRLVGRFEPPPGIGNIRQAVAEGAAAPIDYPPLHQSIVPGDLVTIVLGHRTPGADEIIAGMWSELALRDVSPGDVTIVQPVNYSGRKLVDPRSALPESFRNEVQWRIHDPLKEDECGYLATTSDGQRIYLSNTVLDAGLVVLAGRVEFDRLWGYRSLQSLLYPGLSTIEALKKSHGQPHDELGVDDSRPLQQISEETSWLLGVQFGVGVVPGPGSGASAVHVGQIDSVLRAAKSSLNSTWRFSPEDRPELVLIALDGEGPEADWEQLAAALHAARNLVARDGRVAVLSRLNAELTDGLALIRDSRKPRDAMRPLREQAPPDLLAATSLARAVEWANVYLLSDLNPDLVEDLFMIPLAGMDEVQRLISGEESCAIIASGQHVCTESSRPAAQEKKPTTKKSPKP